ncbi:nuclear receptor-binding factor 2-like [Anopheles nili]|uniref:nuclear receptor-binding factor 2-like n=1 Tax=Anopheles nili TaxID=185578 RepID=UPI00237A6A72|nr:nuclear receptor-binding factor 2-like [Anopheles nili]
MENSHLNRAHMYGRRAENCAKNRRFDEAMECHRQAVFHFNETLKQQTNAMVQESLQLQRKYHLKQVDLLQVKKQQYDRYLRALEYQRRKNPEFLAQQIEKMDKYNELQVAIYHNLDDTDGLLETLSRNIAMPANQAAGTTDGGSKAVRELITLNHSLHILIQRMSQNVDEYATENEELREKLRYFEKEKESATTEDRKGNTDPASNANEGGLSTQKHTVDLMDDNLSTLAPLEMPVFDLSELDNH